MGESGPLSVDKSVAGVLVVVDGLERRGDSLENSLPNPPVTSQGDPFPVPSRRLPFGKGIPFRGREACGLGKGLLRSRRNGTCCEPVARVISVGS